MTREVMRKGALMVCGDMMAQHIKISVVGITTSGFWGRNSNRILAESPLCWGTRGKGPGCAGTWRCGSGQFLGATSCDLSIGMEGTHREVSRHPLTSAWCVCTGSGGRSCCTDDLVFGIAGGLQRCHMSLRNKAGRVGRGWDQEGTLHVKPRGSGSVLKGMCGCPWWSDD